MKKLITLMLTVILMTGFTLVNIYAQGIGGAVSVEDYRLIDEDGIERGRDTEYTPGALVFDDIMPDQTLYLNLGAVGNPTTALIGVSDGEAALDNNVSPEQLADDDLFKMKVDKLGDGKSLVQVSQYNERSIAGSARSAWLKIEIGDVAATEELKAVMKLTFTARDDEESGIWSKGDYAKLNLTLWIQNDLQEGDNLDMDAGNQIVFEPLPNEKNTITWEDVAALDFMADDDANKFYAKLSTQADPDIYAFAPESDLYFRDFTGTPAISATSRAVLTLKYPWNREKGGYPDPVSCRIYAKDTDGMLTDVTNLFTYVNTDEEGNEIDGWQMRTRTLGCYIITDSVLKITDAQPEKRLIPLESPEIKQKNSENSKEEDGIVTSNSKPVPLTGG